jgi:sulfur relay (sulfurtransferase) DsrC/TusE family protein
VVPGGRSRLAAEHWDTVDYVRLYQSFGLLPNGINDV